MVGFFLQTLFWPFSRQSLYQHGRSTPRSQHSTSWETFGVDRLYCASVMLHWISLIQTFTQNNTNLPNTDTKRNTWKIPRAADKKPRRESRKDSGPAESLQHSCDCGGKGDAQGRSSWAGPGIGCLRAVAASRWCQAAESESLRGPRLLHINSASRETETRRSWTAAHLSLLDKAVVHLCGVSYRARTSLTKPSKRKRALAPSHTSTDCGND